MIPTKLTVVFADHFPLVVAQEPVEHRRVTVELTQEQAGALQTKHVGTACGNDLYEHVAMVMLEFPDYQEPSP